LFIAEGVQRYSHHRNGTTIKRVLRLNLLRVPLGYIKKIVRPRPIALIKNDIDEDKDQGK
jgi:hypothetical protein